MSCPLVLQKEESLWCENTFIESVDANLVDMLLKSPLIKDKDKPQLINIKKKIINGTIQVTYSFGEIKGFARVYSSCSLGPLSKISRHTLAGDEYDDIDIKCCAQSILLHICKINNIKCENLEKYVMNRDNILQELSLKYKVEKDDIKELFNSLTNGGLFKTWCENKFKSQKLPSEFIKNYIDEMKCIRNLIFSLNPLLAELVKKKKEKENKEIYNIEGSVLSYFIQSYERKVLECVYIFLKENEKIINNDCIYCCDGIMIKKIRFYIELLDEISNEVEKKTGFKLQFIKKEMNLSIKDQLIEEMNKINEELNNKDEFNPVLLCSIPSYEQQKEYFEKFVQCVMIPKPLFVYSSLDDGKKVYNLWNESELKTQFKPLKTLEKNGKTISFINKWLDDANRKTFYKCDFMPKNAVDIDNNSKNYNLFRGYNPQILTSYDKSKSEKMLQLFKDLLFELCGGEQESFDYFVKLIANKIQFPEKKVPKAVIFQGKEGTGKSLLIATIANIFGLKYYITSSNPDDFFGPHANGFYQKLIVNMNEVEGKQTFDIQGMIKSAITEDTMQMNEKFQSVQTIGNFSLMIITTNKDVPVNVDSVNGARRWVVYKTTDKFLHKDFDGKFWERTYNYFRTPEFVACLYDYFNNMDVSTWDYKNSPMTEAFKKLCRSVIPNECLFLEKYVEGELYNEIDSYSFDDDDNDDRCEMFNKSKSDEYNEEIRKKGSVLYNMFLIWCKKYGKPENKPTIRSFYSKIENLNIPICRKTSGGSEYMFFKPKDVIDYLISKDWVIGNYEKKEKEEINEEENKNKHNHYFEF